MSFHSWLQNLRSALALGRGQRRGRRGSLRAATHRPNLEVLEDRLTPSFSPATSFPVGPYLRDMVAGDFNNDGHLDLATANAGTVSVLLGDGRGSYGAAIDSDTGALPGAWWAPIAVGDFTGDGNLDLAVDSIYPDWESFYGELNVLPGNGNGTFQAPIPVTAVYGFSESDGLVDMMWLDAAGDYVSVEGYSIYGTTYLLAAGGDPNGDGSQVAVIGGISFRSNGDDRFREATSESLEIGIDGAVADFTGDGIPDMLFLDGAGVDVWCGHSDGTFDDPIGSSANGSTHSGLAVADFNGDGKLDAVTSDGDTGTVSLMLGNGNGTLTYAGSYTVGSSANAIVTGDFNGDGLPDVAVVGNDYDGNGAVNVLLNNGDWTPLLPSLRIGDATVTEGNAGTVAAAFTVTLSVASTDTITVAYATADGNATAGSDYQFASGMLTFAPGETTKTITVPVIGDRLPEPNETFTVNLTGATNATIADGQGIGTIYDDEPRISITNATVNEGNTGTRPITFTVNLSAAYDVPVTLSYAAANNTATAGSDYQAASGTLTIPAGQTSGTITVQVNGDRLAEPNETFFVNLSNPNYGVISGGQGVGTIVDDEPRISISDVSKKEGKKNQTTQFTFTVTLSIAYDQPVTMSYQTVNGTATTGDGDYAAKTGTLTFKPGETSKTITIDVTGDSKKEADETFYLDLFGLSSNALFTKNRGLGTILNDD